MTKIIQKMAHSAKIFLNTDRIRKDGKASIYLRVIIDRVIKKINLDIAWYPEYFQNEKCLPRDKKDKTYSDINLIIDDALAKSTEIFIQYRLRRKALLMSQFLVEFKTNLNKDDFLAFYEWKMLQRLKEGEIELSTRISHQVTLNHLRAWKSVILFSELNDRTAYQFEKYLIKKTGAKTINARWGQHRNFRTYLNAAHRDKIDFIHPYDYFKVKTTRGRFIPLTQEQFYQIWEGYQAARYLGTEREVVRAFLFCCVTGMRHGDVRRVSLDWIDGDFFDFTPYKTRKHGTRVRVPASKEALDLIADEVDEVGRSPLFRRITEQKQNQFMRQIGKEIGFNINLCFQVARETFATLYMEHDGKLEVLASFLGHTTTKMSEKYVKIRDQRKRQEMERISAFVKRKGP
jgi:integrase